LKLQEIIGKTFEDLDIGNEFLNRTPVAQELRAIIDKWNFINFKSFCISKETIARMKRQPTNWEKIFAIFSSDKALISRIYKELQKLSTQRTYNPMNKCGNALNRWFLREVQMINKYVKKCSISLAMKEIQTKATLKFHLTTVRIAIRKKTNKKILQRMWRRRNSYTLLVGM
jgi:hypothetical protein